MSAYVRRGDSRQGELPRGSHLRRSLGRKSLSDFNELRQEAVWTALGRLLAKELKQGRGVWIPKFGQFTFTAAAVDLAGSTNPQLRDHQERFPVFLIAKDFVNSLPMKAGIQSGMTLDIFDPQG